MSLYVGHFIFFYKFFFYLDVTKFMWEQKNDRNKTWCYFLAPEQMGFINTLGHCTLKNERKN